MKPRILSRVYLIVVFAFVFVSCSKVGEISSLNEQIMEKFGYQNEVTWNFSGGKKILKINLVLAGDQTFDINKRDAIKRFAAENFGEPVDAVVVNVIDSYK